MIYALDLFSGIGGMSIAIRKYARTICYCESDRYAQGVLLSRMRSGDIDRAPICCDVRNLNGKMLPRIDIITAGFPCQDISVAGTGKGLAGQRSGLFYEIVRLIKETKPKFVFLENVPAIRTRGLNEVIKEISELGYDCRWTIVSAAEIGAIHIRKRWFLLAYSNSQRLRKEQRKKLQRPGKIQGQMEPDSKSSTRETSQPLTRTLKPNMVRAGDGISNIVDRNRCLGNSVVPEQAKKAFEKLIGLNQPNNERVDEG